MITRSDLQIYGSSPTDFDSLIASQMDTTVDYPMDHSEMHYAEAKYPASIYELSQDIDSNAKQKNTSVALSKIVDDMLRPSNTISNHGFSQSAEIRIGGYESCVIKEDISNANFIKENTSRISINPDKLIMPTKDEFNIKDEFETFSYSHPATPSESVVSSDKYSNPLCQIENIPFSSSYNEVKSESEMNVVKPTCLEQRNYDTSSLMYDNDDMTPFTGLVNCDEVLKSHKPKDNLNEQNGTIVCCYRSGSSSSSSDEGRSNDTEWIEKEKQERDENYFSPQETPTDDAENRKGKISGLQRRALDSIFSVTDRPSRGLVLHIAGELRLHHITVKNFFSNGRRRLRRAAARLSDPERTRRENQKRKEKRRLAALAAAASAANGEKGGNSSTKGSSEGGNDSQSPRDPPVLSPERRALMEKLAVKVQRSVAQKGLAASNRESICLPTSLSSSTLYNPNHFPPNSLENTVSTQLHSNPMNLNEPNKSFAIQQVEDSFLNKNGEEFGAIFSYPESEPMSSYDSSPDQNSVNMYSSEHDSTNTYALINQEGPYSPTSWQTLLHT